LNQFVFEARIPRVVFGIDSLGSVEAEVARLGCVKALVLSTPYQQREGERVVKLLGQRAAGLYAQAEMHVPIELARAARTYAADRGADCLVAIGGGSTIGLAKAIAVESSLPIVAIPTTYAGSEMTPIYGLTEGGIKKTGRDEKVIPKTVIYDPRLTATLPLTLTASSCLNAIAHAAESIYAHDVNPIISMMAEDGIRASRKALVWLLEDPDDLEIRANAQYGSWLCGIALGSVSMGLHHKLCHVLGGMFNLPHSDLHAVVLPYSLAYNLDAAPAAMRRIAAALALDHVPTGLFDLLKKVGLPQSLQAIGMPEAGIEQTVELVTASPYPNPRPFERGALLHLVTQAWHGERPV
jgi:maleylacetate reductase